MKPAARISDMHVCPMFDGPKPHVGGPILPPGCPTVLIGGLPAARVGDMAACAGPPDVIVVGAFTVLIGGQPAARMGDQTAHGGAIVMGFPTVLIGEGGGGSAGPGGAAFGAAAQSALSLVPIDPGPLADLLPPDVRALAAAPGDAPDQREARRKVAKAFYLSEGRKLDPEKGERLMLEREIDDHLDAIDLSQPVSAGPPPELPGNLSQYGPPDGMAPGAGSYAGPAGATPSELGIGPLVTTADGRTLPKVSSPAPPMLKGTPYLQSTAAPAVDTWSAKNPDGTPMEQPTTGGAAQYYVPAMMKRGDA